MSETTLLSRHGRRQRIGYADPYLSASLREFRLATEGLSQRLPLRGCESMRLGRQPSPYQHIAQFLDAGRRARLPREWALRVAGFVATEVARLFPLDLTPLPLLRARALAAELRYREVESHALLSQQSTKSLEAEANALRELIVAHQRKLEGIERTLSERKAGGHA